MFKCSCCFESFFIILPLPAQHSTLCFPLLILPLQPVQIWSPVLLSHHFVMWSVCYTIWFIVPCAQCSIWIMCAVAIVYFEMKEVEESGDLGFLLPTFVNINSFFIVENSDSHISSLLFPRIILVSCLLWPVSGEVFGEWIFGFLMLAENIINCKLQRENSQTELAGRSFLKVKNASCTYYLVLCT